jgi:hypothetical protein
MKSTIDKLIKDKKELAEMVKERENDISKFNDPKNLKELKSLLTDLDSSITSMEVVKSQQYDEMKLLLDIMNYKPSKWKMN